ncbi:BolA/IbaG family iron-sulfur metabolism protein [Francisella frigiditurris]|uniref:BolA-like family protein n=1 Tax=Francisella frigiditurris TaxID=1542390 RepID=A0A1J0KUI6_9GAMM|nr:BolA family protein [Francisella frigiditurris]APC97343.1 bolA-like family protein [Francisella frigiditurris]
MNSSAIATEIKQNILEKIDSNAEINIVDETHKHKKHKGFIEGKYHFLIEINSKELNNLSRLKAHQEIYKSLGNLMQYIHALSIKLIN